MKTFKERKRHCLWKMEELDRSKKGSVDESARPLLEAINAHPDYYSTSSCGGRILLLAEPESGKKNEYAWPLVTHGRAEAEEFISALRGLSGHHGLVWLRMQTVIVHVACRDVEAARRLLGAFYSHGWKRSGIFSLEQDVMVELLSVEHMDAPVQMDGARVVDDDYMRLFIEEANRKLSVAHGKIRAGAERVRALSAQNL